MAYPKLNMVNKRLVHTYIIAKHVPRLWNSCILWVACGGHLRGACTIDHAGDCSRQCQKTSCLFRVTYQFTQQSMRDWNSLLNASSLYTKRRRHYWTTSLNAVWIHPYRHSSHEKRYKKTRGNLCTACMAMVLAALINYHCHRQPKPNDTTASSANGHLRRRRRSWKSWSVGCDADQKTRILQIQLITRDLYTADASSPSILTSIMHPNK